jgi:hypothetical protein
VKPYGVEIDPEGLRGTGWRDYALRFILGGVVTASAGVIAKIYGPVIGGLFLAFPAIFPASATLMEPYLRDDFFAAFFVAMYLSFNNPLTTTLTADRPCRQVQDC